MTDSKASMQTSADIVLANPRGFCAGVDRAIIIVEQALEKFGAPIYVRNEVVHNKFVVDGLRAKGAIFVKKPATRAHIAMHAFANTTDQHHTFLNAFEKGLLLAFGSRHTILKLAGNNASC